MPKIIDEALQNYLKNWDALITSVNSKALRDLKPTAVGWKVADETEYQQQYAKLRPACDKIVETWMNDRWIAKLHLKDNPLAANIEIIKLMQRRPGSSDALGLDHVDFMCHDIRQVEAQLQSNNLRWSWENNDVIDGYDWISVWFDKTEAKIKQGTVIDIVMQELNEINQRIKR